MGFTGQEIRIRCGSARSTLAITEQFERSLLELLVKGVGSLTDEPGLTKLGEQALEGFLDSPSPTGCHPDRGCKMLSF